MSQVSARPSPTPEPPPRPGPFNPEASRPAPLVRLQKFLSEAGVASRRGAEAIILSGRVKINGAVVQQLGTKVHPDRDHVAVDGRLVHTQKKFYLALNKPPAFLCTRADPQQRRTIFDLIPKAWQHLHTVGRLDNDSEGLIFLTNDGNFSLHLTHPRYGIRKTYEVTVNGRVRPQQLEQLVEGVFDCGEKLRAQTAHLLASNNTRSVIKLQLSEGKNREIRRLMAACDLTVTRLLRTAIGPVRLGELPSGKWRTLTEREITSLLQTL